MFSEIDFPFNYIHQIWPSRNPVSNDILKKQWLRFSLLTFFKSSSFVRYYCTYGLFFVPRPTILYIKKKWKLVRVFNSMTRSVCVNYKVSSLCILHDANLVSKRYIYIYISTYTLPYIFSMFFRCGPTTCRKFTKQTNYAKKWVEWYNMTVSVSLLNCFTLWQHPASHWMCCSTFFCYNLALLKYQIIQTQ